MTAGGEDLVLTRHEHLAPAAERRAMRRGNRASRWTSDMQLRSGAVPQADRPEARRPGRATQRESWLIAYVCLDVLGLEFGESQDRTPRYPRDAAVRRSRPRTSGNWMASRPLLRARRDPCPRNCGRLVLCRVGPQALDHLPPLLVPTAGLQAEPVPGPDHVDAERPIAGVDAVNDLARCRHGARV